MSDAAHLHRVYRLMAGIAIGGDKRAVLRVLKGLSAVLIAGDYA